MLTLLCDNLFNIRIISINRKERLAKPEAQPGIEKGAAMIDSIGFAIQFKKISQLFVTIPALEDIIVMEDTKMTFHSLYKLYANDVYRFSYWLTGNEADAKDITSETFVRVWTAKTGPRTETLKAYLFTIARNLFLKSQQRKKRFFPMDEKMVSEATQPDKG